MRSLLFVLSFTLLLTSCKKQAAMTTVRDPASLGGCKATLWANHTLPLTLVIGSDLENYLPPGSTMMKDMSQRWSSQVHSTLGLIKEDITGIVDPKYSNPAEYRFHNKPVGENLGIYKSDSWFTGFGQDALAVTQYFVNTSSGNITHADIFFNFKDFGHNFNGANGYFHYDLSTIALHEFGHLLGICHSDNGVSVMNPRYEGIRIQLENKDVDLIKNKYDHIIAYQSQGMTAGGHGALGAIKRRPTQADLDDEVRAIVELKANGDCNHYIDGRLVEAHKVDLAKLK